MHQHQPAPPSRLADRHTDRQTGRHIAKYTHHPSTNAAAVAHKNPLLKLTCLLRLLFLFGMSRPFVSAAPNSLPFAQPALPTLLPTALPALSTRSAFQPSNSLSSRRAFSLSSLNSLSARLARSWLLESLDCNSSIVFSSFSTLSRAREMSSCKPTLALSLRSICSCKSFTVRSTLRTSRWDLDCWVRWSSSCCSSCLFR